MQTDDPQDAGQPIDADTPTDGVSDFDPDDDRPQIGRTLTADDF